MNKQILFQEVNEGNQHDWYKKMYNTIHKVSDGGKFSNDNKKFYQFFFFSLKVGRNCELIRNEDDLGYG